MSLRALRPVSRALAAAAAASRPATLRTAPIARQAALPALRTFSVSARRLGSGESDGALSAAIQAEQQYEAEEAANLPEVPEFVEHFNQQGVWDLKDVPGAEDVILSRKFGNETLELTFQVSEVDPVPVASEEAEAAEAEAEAADAPPIVTASLVISKPGHPNAMSIDLDAGEEGLVISNVAMFERSVAVQKGSEGDWARRERYLGPRIRTTRETLADL